MEKRGVLLIRLEVSVPVSLDQNFTYLFSVPISAGCRVVVPFGEKNRKLIGVVIGLATESGVEPAKLKWIEEVVDERPVYSPAMMLLAEWMSRYYMFPLGEIFKQMLPASQKKSKAEVVSLTEMGLGVLKDPTHTYHGLLSAVWKRGSVLNAKLVKQRFRDYFEKTGVRNVSIGKLERLGILACNNKHQVRARAWVSEVEAESDRASSTDSPKALTTAQLAVLRAIVEYGLRSEGDLRVPILLHGITGAGKTELYLQAIETLFRFEPDSQVLVLVPEISLTPQMTRLFSARFSGKVAVVHSSMSPKDRWDQISLIRDGSRSILIGPRSAVFAPFKALKFLIVDEEHDSSYKQGAGLSYNARDVAVMRGKLETATVLLGSATPSLESYQNSRVGKYKYLSLNERPQGRKLPTIELVQPTISGQFAKYVKRTSIEPKFLDLPVDPSIIKALQENFSAGMQSMVIVNRRGYAYYLYSLKSKKAVVCPQCSISLTVHKRSTVLCCHYCGHQTPVSRVIGDASIHDYVIVGYGSEQMEDFLRESVKGARICRLDSDSTGQKDFLQKSLAQFRSGEIDILVGTQMLAKGHDFPKVSLICILEIDQILNLPDFRAGERAFQLMVQASGRAGRGECEGRVLIQTLKPEHPILKAGLAQDYSSFYEDQSSFRHACHYPPFSRMILFEFSSAERELVGRFADKVQQWLNQTIALYGLNYKDIQILGPAIPPIELVRGRHRRTLLLVGGKPKELWSLANHIRSAFKAHPGDISIRIDVDPQSLM